MDKKDEINVYVSIVDFLELDEIKDLIEIKESKYYLKGDIRDPSRPKILAKNNIWVLKSRLVDEYKEKEDEYWLEGCLREHMKYVLSLIKPYKEKISILADKYYGEFSVSVYNYDSRPGIHIDKSITKLIGEYNFALDIDIYCFNELNKDQ